MIQASRPAGALRWQVPYVDGVLPELPPPVSDTPSVFAFSLAKAGSTLMFNLLRGLAPAAGAVFFSLDDLMFKQGQPLPLTWPGAARLFRPRGYCYGGYRGLPRHALPPFADSRSILLVRDPRDMIVSQYYSFRESHTVPADAGPDHPMARARAATSLQTLAQFAPSAAQRYARRFEAYLALGFAWRPNVVVYRYEDVIFRKAEWVDDICDWYQWPIPAEIRQRIVARYDILPETADPTKHIRQVHPGNHRTEMEAKTIKQVETILDQAMAAFGYR
jgi:hypothetical protein